MPAATWGALIDAGVMVSPLDADHAELRTGPHRDVLRVVHPATTLNPSHVAKLRDRYREPILLIVPSATSAVRAAVEAAGWSWLIDDGKRVTGSLRLAGHRVAVGPQNAGLPSPPARPGRVPWGTFTLLRRLVERPWAGQQQLAEATGLSQPRVSQALAALSDEGIVSRASTGWDVTDIDAAFDWWLRSYPGPHGLRTLWYGLDPPVRQAQSIVGLLTRDGQQQTVISGDVAADIIAPWRSPRRAIVYARTGADLAPVGLTPAHEEDATVELIVPKDPGVWPSPAAEEPPGGLPLADALQILWDVARAPGPDTDEAMRQLRRVLRDRRPRSAREQAA
ncbi:MULTISPECIES: winged helix-turn-helix domain-containing protein [Micromonospora]|nr:MULTISPECIES: winged helix-turn-helix domain-containing protein [Micromonospora]NES16423.1 winged helix-turn-helix transcriptional regulator [Micromonospora sp. PPF5-17B]NES37224.1 winged helix-turn-helix transcriptional regulator [Micromonospora solifontis]